MPAFEPQDRFLESSEPHERLSEVVQRVGVVGTTGDRLLVGCAGRLEVSGRVRETAGPLRVANGTSVPGSHVRPLRQPPSLAGTSVPAAGDLRPTLDPASLRGAGCWMTHPPDRGGRNHQ